MPTRTYQSIDFVNYVEAFISNNATGAAVAVATPSGQFNVTIASSGNASFVGDIGVAQLLIDYLYQLSGDLDFDAFPAIPPNARITKIEVRIDVESSGTAGATVSSGSAPTVVASSNCNAHADVFVDGDIDPLPDVAYADDDGGQDINNPASHSSAISGFDHFTAVQVLDFSSSPLTRAELVAQFTSWIVQLNGAASGVGLAS